MLKKKFLPSPLNCKKAEVMSTSAPIRIPRGLFVVLLLCRIVCQVWMMRLTPLRRDLASRLGRLVRSEFERLGGLWIKAGHILAAANDAYPKAFCDELANIRDDAAAFPGEVAKAIVQKELGRPANDIFREFDVVPVATTSFGQIHVAWLRENDIKVAIKIERPGTRQVILQDLSLLSGFASLLHFLYFFSSDKRAKLNQLEQRIRQMSVTMLDYRRKAEAMQRIRGEMKPKKVYIPKIFSRYCTSRIIVMEFIDGVPIADYERACATMPNRAENWRRDNGIRDEKLRRRIAKLARGLPKNLNSDIMVLRDNRIVLLDVDACRYSDDLSTNST